MDELKKSAGKGGVNARGLIPFLTTPEVITCDNTEFSTTHRDEDRQGVSFSVPFYGPDNVFKGRLRRCFGQMCFAIFFEQ